MKKPGFKIPFKLIFLLLLLAAVYLSIVALLGGLKNLDYFKIKEVIVTSGEKAEDFAYFKGQGIFNINLESESERLWQSRPSYKKVRLIRILPNRLMVDFLKRLPIAYLKLYRYFCIDEELVLLEATGEPEENSLPVILGLETKIFGPKVGKQYNIKELSLAVTIIREFKKNRLSKYGNIKNISVTNPVSTFFITGQDLEVRIGQDNVGPRMELLRSLMAQTRNELSRIKYIDLRFKDPVIKLKEDARQ